MRLLFLNHNVAFRGTFFRAHQLARELTGRGHEVVLVTTSRTARLEGRWREIDGVPVFEAPDLLFGPGRSGWDAWNALRRVLALRGRRFDLVHAFDARPVVIGPALEIRRRTGAPLVLDWADWWGRGGRIEERSGALVRTLFGPVETWFEEAFRTRADASTVISRALETRLEELGVGRDRILRVPNGSDLTGIQPGSRAEARRRLDVDGNGPREGGDGSPLVLHLGVLTRGDAALLLGAFRAARATVTGLRMVLINPQLPIPETAGVRQTGFVDFDELRDWLAAADVGLVPLEDTVGNRGRWPGRVNDYLAAGRPVLMTRVGDAPEYLEAAGAGRAVSPEPAALGSALTEMLRDRKGLEAAGRQARRLAETELAWPRIADRVEQLYRQVS